MLSIPPYAPYYQCLSPSNGYWNNSSDIFTPIHRRATTTSTSTPTHGNATIVNATFDDDYWTNTSATVDDDLWDDDPVTDDRSIIWNVGTIPIFTFDKYFMITCVTDLPDIPTAVDSIVARYVDIMYSLQLKY